MSEAKFYMKNLIFKFVDFFRSSAKKHVKRFGIKKRMTSMENRPKLELESMEQYNLDQHQLEEYYEKARVILIKTAKRRTLITYDTLMYGIGHGPGRKTCGAIVRRVSEIEIAEGRPKLSAVIIRGDTRMVGGGFFGLPGTPDSVKRSNSAEWQNPYLSPAEQEYWGDELRKVYDYWHARFY